jgi:carboxyl-terminal processing protease
MPRRNVTWLLGMLIFTLFCWTIVQGGFTSNAASHGPLQLVKGLGSDEQDYELMKLFLDVRQHVDMAYVHELTPEERRKFMEAAIEGGLQSLDQHSNFFNEREFAQFRKVNRGTFGGIGVNIVVPRDTKRLTVVTPIIGTPAYKAGVKPGDEIMKIEGVPTDGWTSEDAVDKITGKPGTPVKITIRHRGSARLIDLTLVRSQIEVDSVFGDLRDSQQKWDFLYDKDARIGYIRVANFGQKTHEELHKALEQLEAQNVTGLVLDLRNNPGGLLESAVLISNMFLKPGQKIVSIAGRTRSNQTYEAEPGKKFLEPAKKHPIVILVNEGSASASEIVAAALQDNQRAIIMGERSYGKGSVQNMIEMESGKSALKLTTAKYMRPNGKNIHRFPDSKETDDWGVRPDMEIKLTPKEELDYFLARRDRDIVRGKPTPAEQTEQIAKFCLPFGSMAAYATPWRSVVSAAQLYTTQQSLPQPPYPFNDKALDQAVKYLRERLAAQTATRG